MIEKQKSYDLEDRTLRFSKEVIKYCSGIKYSPITSPMISQLIRSATSIGANYCEANNASSKKDFRNKIYICKKECQETKYWLTLLEQCDPSKKDIINSLRQECHELTLIFQKIISSMDKPNV